MSRSGRIESEVALIITDRAEQTAGAIADLSVLLDYRMSGRRYVVIHDTYFDTGSKDFTRRRISFRLRRQSGRVVLSVKSNPKRLTGGGTSRFEIERPWSYESLSRTLRKLDIEPPTRERFRLSPRSPLRILNAAGLEVIQDRLTRRKSRDLIAFSKTKSSRFAELSIDDVTYTFPQGSVRLLEIEIEAKAYRALPRIQRAVSRLLSDYPSLQIWPHGKFVTGLAIKKLLKQRGHRFLTTGNLLRARAFKMIDGTIGAGPL